ncbi:glycoside hydrolase family 20 protein [Gramella sp. AN32]|uniref:beta-N-acetylhexosaminidase n=1 Tax=Christiangramia antarctica TaxID=2058158 RepID=A0ABW5WZY7_9FLAO|nr:glycoside hydrolase family 20 protein [Gramella sp. AN32]MCM4156980.1 beta-N-acetylhexosaminidase [Gramella sp. AN32]
MKTILKAFLILNVAFFSSCGDSEKKTFSEEEVMLIPRPAKMELKEGSFRFDKNTVFVANDEEQEKLSALLIDKFKSAAGFSLKTVSEKPKANFVQYKENKELGEEGYTLKVDNNSIFIEAGGFAGYLYALESIRQLLPPEIENDQIQDGTIWLIPNLEINDKPRYKWRGLMLDVSRHFFEKEYILKTIDRLAMLKLNTLHLHLVDDQGWRIEIKKYPKLTEVGAWRVDQESKHWNARSQNEPGVEATYGGFYTQEDIKEIVAYAKDRAISVVPEIEMPAHVMSAIAAYPELSCTGEPIAIPSGGVWPITDIYCPGKETTFEFLEDVLLEVMELFPSKYIHVGGDEATKTEWEKCPDCQRRMKEEGLANVEELQSYFIKRMERFISSHDRILIGWDEILEGGLAPGATVMSWRGIDGGWEASKQGHDVIMSPGTPLYFNHYQGDPDKEPIAQGGYNPLHLVYEFDPVVDSMSIEQKEHVLGAQANLWSEYIPTESHSEYMLFPRLAALSEILWTPEEKKDWNNFTRRLENLKKRFDYLDINYSTTMYDVTADATVDSATGKISIRLKSELPDAKIRYTLDGKKPNPSSEVYEDPVLLDSSSNLKAAVFEDGKLKGDVLEKEFRFHKAVGSNVNYEPKYSDRYTGIGEKTTVNVLRGSKNFHDGQWLGWMGKDVSISVDLGEPKSISKISVGSMADQGSGIYFPVKLEYYISTEKDDLKLVGEINREFENKGFIVLKDFTAEFEQETARFVKVKITNFKKSTYGGSWTFIDEIIVE